MQSRLEAGRRGPACALPSRVQKKQRLVGGLHYHKSPVAPVAVTNNYHLNVGLFFESPPSQNLVSKNQELVPPPCYGENPGGPSALAPGGPQGHEMALPQYPLLPKAANEVQCMNISPVKILSWACCFPCKAFSFVMGSPYSP